MAKPHPVSPDGAPLRGRTSRWLLVGGVLGLLAASIWLVARLSRGGGAMGIPREHGARSTETHATQTGTHAAPSGSHQVSTAASSAAVPLPGPVVLDDLGKLSDRFRVYVTRFVDRVRESPGDPARHAELGLVYEANDRLLAAQASFENALRLGMHDPLLRYHQAVVTEKLGDVELALQLLDRLAEDYPGFAPAHQRRGILLLEAGRVQEAEEAFQTVITLKPAELAGHTGLAQIRLRNKEFAEAAAILEPLVRGHPRVKMPHYLLGMAYRGIGAGREADAQRELALGAGARKLLLPDEWTLQLPKHDAGPSVRARVVEAREYLDGGAVEQGVERLQYALSWHPDDPEVLTELGVALLRLDRVSEAGEHLNRSETLAPDRAVTASGLAEYHLRNQRLAEALSHVDRAISLEPEVPDHFILKGKVLFSQRAIPEAYAALKEAARLDDHNVEAWMGVGTAALRLEQLDEARSCFLRVIELDPGFIQGHIGLCQVSLQQGDVGQAAIHLRSAEEIAPHDPQVAAMTKRLQESP